MLLYDVSNPRAYDIFESIRDKIFSVLPEKTVKVDTLLLIHHDIDRQEFVELLYQFTKSHVLDIEDIKKLSKKVYDESNPEAEEIFRNITEKMLFKGGIMSQPKTKQSLEIKFLLQAEYSYVALSKFIIELRENLATGRLDIEDINKLVSILNPNFKSEVMTVVADNLIIDDGVMPTGLVSSSIQETN